ncbi:MAG: hypothetical protein CL933_06910 [Deltaproteobacteria bacterium]|nr:hypothetical protein [Deltaproteobacteria bacterium]
MSQGYLNPPIDSENEGFWEGTRRGELSVEQCGGCNALRFPPKPMCPHCRSTERRWVPVAGEGTIWSFVLPHPPLLPEFTELAPYNVIVVALSEDPTLRMIGNLVNEPGDAINAFEPSRIEIDARVRVVFEAVSDEIQLPRWVLA